MEYKVLADLKKLQLMNLDMLPLYDMVEFHAQRRIAAADSKMLELMEERFPRHHKLSYEDHQIVNAFRYARSHGVEEQEDILRCIIDVEEHMKAMLDRIQRLRVEYREYCVS